MLTRVLYRRPARQLAWVCVQVEQDRAQPVAERLPPLTPTELSIIQETLQEHRGNRQVWDIISQQKLRYRNVEELKALYWTMACRADTNRINSRATTTTRGGATRTSVCRPASCLSVCL